MRGRSLSWHFSFKSILHGTFFFFSYFQNVNLSNIIMKHTFSFFSGILPMISRYYIHSAHVLVTVAQCQCVEQFIEE